MHLATHPDHAHADLDFAAQQRLVEHELRLFRRRLQTLKLPEGPPDIRLAVEHIHAHLFDAALSVGGVREACGLTGGDYSWHFKRCCRMGMKRYIEDRRLLAAMRLLGFPPLEVGTIAPSIGYRSPQSFARAFRRRIGVAPTGFRKKARRQEPYVPPRYDRPAFHRLVRGGCSSEKTCGRQQSGRAV